MLISDAINDFMLACRVEQKSKKTMEMYEYALRIFQESTGEIDVTALMPTHIRAFIAYQMKRVNKNDDSKIMSTQSLHKFYSVVRTFVRWMYDQEMIRVVLTDFTKAPKVDNDLPDAMTDQELKQLFEWLDENAPFRDKVIFELFLDTGARMEEVCKLNLEDVHISDGWIKVFGKGRKEGMVFIGAKMSKDLNTYILRHRRPKDSSETALFLNKFGTRLGREGLSMMSRRAMAAANISGKRGPHKLRHTFATNFLRNGGNLEALRRIMRHSNIQTTQRYTNLLTADVQSEHKSASPLDNFTRKR